ncbi:purine and uridine phosphorylase [Aspergillus candidus]|uniref:Purine and uridine phosphorylase n=1 Tax=Aspergillus candidus TaxID=41067 RepID=A0A2I2FPT7_ASPCN|nr:purine and uridine phosphorylase [Aspergillus candidus]PLB42630.1 purine and uridine phosphorylase [Aspergillus candidus]
MPQELHNHPSTSPLTVTNPRLPPPPPPPHTPLPNEAYTIGWICAIHVEYVAARAFLDEKHGLPTQVAPNNSSVYTLGRMGSHNVVIGVLAAGEYGIASAANVARDMLNSFPNVRLGLMVGIGGGVPSERHDVRLGDVVVSVPCEGVGGVLQYDYGKTEQGGDGWTTRFLNLPPVALRGAVMDLAARYEEEGNGLEDAVDDVLGRMPKLRKGYQRPERGRDRLYQSGFVHSGEACVEGRGEDPMNLVWRPERGEEGESLEIHYGMIASADRPMRDARVRDKLAAENHILCFDASAGGLMNYFPCLVIRGICDYSDSHESSEWEGFATMAAAAYGKDLLCRVPTSRVEAEKKLADILSDVHEMVGIIHDREHDQDRETILKWLAPTEGLKFSSKQNEYVSLRTHRTGEWFLKTPEFQTWMRNDNRTLFCPGIPGAGKTLMTSIVVDHLEKHFDNANIAYVYCSFGLQDQTPEGFLGSVLQQLVRKQSPLPKIVKDLYSRHKDKSSRPGLKALLEVLNSIIPSDSRTFIIVDALDECQNHNRCRDSFLSAIFAAQVKTRLSFFATSRPQGVEARFRESIVREIVSTKHDLKIYLDNRISSWEKVHGTDLDGLRTTIKTEIITAADGMFLFAVLDMNALQSLETKGEIQDALRNPYRRENRLLEAYGQTMERIQRQEESPKRLAMWTLAWVLYARRPLSAVELRYALALNAKLTEAEFESYLPNIRRVLSLCAGLVSFDETSKTIDFVHKSTRDYFEATKGIRFLDAELKISRVCAAYLSFGAFRSGCCQTDEDFEERLQTHPFYNYAANYWGHHARESAILCPEVMNFLECETAVQASTQALLAIKCHPRSPQCSQKFPREMTGLHLAACFGVEGAVKHFLQKGIAVDAKDTDGHTPLSCAARNGHVSIVQILLASEKAKPDMEDRSG